MEGEEEEEEQVSGQVHERDTEKEQEGEIGGMVVSQTTENKGNKERIDGWMKGINRGNKHNKRRKTGHRWT